MNKCQLSLVFAKDAPVAVILRRGPSEWVEVIKWNTKTDIFTRGHWFHGRIYENKCDLSPDGLLFVYFAFKKGHIDPGYDRRYTAVSKPPWLTAIGLWPNGTTYGGGGVFTGRRELSISFGYPLEPHPKHVPKGLTVRFGENRPYSSRGQLVDQGGKKFIVRGGKILRKRGSLEREIADFTEDVLEAVASPDWAKK